MKNPMSLIYPFPRGWMFFSLLAVLSCFAFTGFYKIQNGPGINDSRKLQYYTVADFEKIPKIDVHFHYNTPDTRYLLYAKSLNFRLISPNVDTEIPIDKQLEITRDIKQKYPDLFAFWGTFSVDSFGRSDFAGATIDRIALCMKSGACGIKIWKNIGMSLLDKEGHYVMVDNPGFDKVFDYMEKQKIQLIAHLGEPKNCWLPVDQMTTANDKRYYQNHPQYHMFLHPEAPTYKDQINARNHLLQNHPGLEYIGAHLASEEWNVDELAKNFDTYPNLKADMAARISHLQYQSSKDREKVRNFLIKYQDRILYGTDYAVNEKDTAYKAVSEGMKRTWMDQWIYLATDSVLAFRDMPYTKMKGLQLPREVIDKIFCRNAEKFFKK
jgi:hypothetical protein